MKLSLSDFVQRDFSFAIVDEVDSILIDEARTPLIISGPSNTASEKYQLANDAVRGLRRDLDYSVDEKSRNVALTEQGIHKIEKRLKLGNLYNPENTDVLHAIGQALKAHVLFRKDDHYIVRDGGVIIVDEFTGRLMQGRRYSDGLHQALEAKEGVKVQQENQTLATITLQNYFRMYKKLSGMTGTADTEAVEFHKIYNLDVVVIPTNQPMIRLDHDDVLFAKQSDKFVAVALDIEEAHKRGQPVLVGTVSVEKSELLSELLTKRNISHTILNAKQHETEAQIIAQAGQTGNVTISTNMAGRGTDIILGEGVAQLGGLYVVGTERHESRRIDNQLRGRSGRQGDQGTSKFFLSWEDDLMKRFNNKASQFVMRFAGDQPITDPSLTRVIGQVQKRVEGFNYDLRKHLLEYDDVLNKQRRAIYAARNDVLNKKSLQSLYLDQALPQLTKTLCDEFLPPIGTSNEGLKVDGGKLEKFIFSRCLVICDIETSEVENSLTRLELYQLVEKKLLGAFQQKEKLFGSDPMAELEGWVMLQSIDSLWKEHLLNIDHLKDGIGLRGYGQKDPLQEYKREAFELFQRLLKIIKVDALENLFRIQPSISPQQRLGAENPEK